MDSPLEPPPGRCADCRSKYCDEATGACDPLVFITVEEFRGDLSAGIDGGLGRADEICQTLAGGVGVFHAWLSDDNQNAISRVVGLGAPSARPLRRWDGALVAASITQLVDEDGGLPLAPINRGPNGELVPNPSRVWTGTHENGGKRAWTCGNWKTSEGSLLGTMGTTAENSLWTVMGGDPNANCDQQAHLYCFEELH